MSTPFNLDSTIREKDTSHALVLVLDVTKHIVGGMLRYHIQIVKQKYTDNQLYRGNNSFTASNGFTFVSASCPALSHHNSGDGGNTYHMYIRGSDRSMDNEVVVSRSLGYVEALKVAVQEYNDCMMHQF